MSDSQRPTLQQLVADGILPSPNPKRWVSERKVKILKAIKGNYATAEQVCGLYGISPEELANWQDLLEQHGPFGLRVTRLKRYREAGGEVSGQERPLVSHSVGHPDHARTSRGRSADRSLCDRHRAGLDKRPEK
jgi:hypothetical protein